MRVKSRMLALTALALVFTFSPSSYAAAPSANNLQKSDLQKLADQFVKRMKSGFEGAEQQLELGASPFTQGRRASSNNIEDGEELILRVLVGSKKVNGNNDVLAIKEKNDVKVSLLDLFSAIDFPITIDVKNGTAEGWFVRENQIFRLDTSENKAFIIDTDIPYKPEQINITDDDIYVDSRLIALWFGMDIKTDLNELAFNIKTSQPLQIEERFNRRKRELTQRDRDPRSKLPETENEYQAFVPPTVDVGLRSFNNRTAEGRRQAGYNWSALSVGDLGYFSNKSFISGSDQNSIQNIRTSFTRTNPDGQLLGPLHAKRFSFGDIEGVTIPLTSGASTEQGVRISSNLEDNNSLFDTKTFENDAIPGWDVELYRNGALLGFQEIGQDGRYRFEDVALFKGDNDFRFIFYGPQGEVREEREFIKVDGRNNAQNNILYDVALTRKDTITYNISDNDDDNNKGSPHLAARFDYLLGNLQLSSGLRMRDQGGQNKTYVAQALSQELGGVLYNLDGAYDLDGEAALSLTARRNFGRHKLRTKTSMNTDGFTQNEEADVNDPGFDNEILTSDIEISGPLASDFLGLKRLQYSGNVEYSETKKGLTVFDASAGINSQIINRFQVNTSLDYQHTKEITGEVKEDAKLSLNLGGRHGTTRWRTGVNYALMPEASLETVSLKLNQPYAKNIELEGEIDHKVDAKITEASLGVNWNTDHAIYSPRLTYDSEGALFAGINTRFGLGYDPREQKYHMYGQNLSSGGAVSARVYLDKDGSGSFTDGDEPLENVDVKSLQTRRIEASDKDGIAYLRALSEGRKTDITVDEGTFEDPFYISIFEGLSVRPRAGVVTEVDFPVAIAGTVDGTLSLQSQGGRVLAARQYKVHLMNLDGTIAASTTTGFDGYYVFERIRPGLYYLSLDNEQIRNSFNDVRMPAPQLISFKPTGTDLFGKNMSLQEGNAFFYSLSSNKSSSERQKNLSFLGEDAIQKTSYQIVVGSYKSKLALGLTWFTIQKDPLLASTLSAFKLQKSYKDTSADSAFNYSLIYDVPADKTLEEAKNACQILADRGQYCRINIHNTLDEPKAMDTAAL